MSKQITTRIEEKINTEIGCLFTFPFKFDKPLEFTEEIKSLPILDRYLSREETAGMAPIFYSVGLSANVATGIITLPGDVKAFAINLSLKYDYKHPNGGRNGYEINFLSTDAGQSWTTR